MEKGSQFFFGPFRLDISDRRLWKGEQIVKLTSQAFDLLSYFVKNPGRLLLKDELLQAIKKPAAMDSTLYVAVKEVRKVLGDDRHKPRFVENEPSEGYRFIAAVSTQGAGSAPAQTPSPEPLRPPEISDTWQPPPGFVGRDTELATLRKLLEKVRDGERQVVFLTGEPGIGKTALVDAFLAEFNKNPTVWVGRGQCIEQYGQGEAYLPILDALGHLSRRSGIELFVKFFARHAPTWLMQMPAILDNIDVESLQRKTQGATRERMLREFVEAVEAFTTQTENQSAPLLILVLEDLHWSDPSTLDLLAMLARRRTPMRFLLIGTYRPTEGLAAEHPLRTVTQELRGHNQCQELAPARLDLLAIEKYIDERFPNNVFPTRFAEVLADRSAGNPLFLTNLVSDFMARELLVEEDGNWMLLASLDDIERQTPESSRHLIQRQMERLPDETQKILEAASITGIEFPTTLIAGTLDVSAEAIEEHCEPLVQHKQFLRRAGISEWPDGTQTSRYGFLHALYQQLWHERVPLHRRQRLHITVSEKLERAYGSRTGEIATELAVHYEEGRNFQRAVQYRQQAAINALQRSAYQEAIGHLTRGLNDLQAWPVVDQLPQELALRTILGSCLIATQGWAATAVGSTYSRAQELCQHLGENVDLFPALFGLWGFHIQQGRHRVACTFAERLVHLAQRLQDTALLVEASWALGCTLFFMGELEAARTHLREGHALYDPQAHRTLLMQYGQDPGMSCLCYLSLTLWRLGYPEQALRYSEDALSLARKLEHPFSLVWALTNVAILHQLRQDERTHQELVDEGIALCQEHGFVFLLQSFSVMRHSVQAIQDPGEKALTLMREHTALTRSLGAEMYMTSALAAIAQVSGNLGQLEEGFAAITEAQTLAEKNEERHFEPELYRIQGELLLQQLGKQNFQLRPHLQQQTSKNTQKFKTTRIQKNKVHFLHPNEAEAQACFQKAIEIAQRQGAKSFELRATMSLCRLWLQQGRKAEARQKLAEIYGWFSEGLETIDLQQARALLHSLP